jgi:uncharacterized membrane protein
MISLLFLYIATGILFIVISIPLIRGRIKPNAWYGLRTSRTLHDNDLWYKANRYSGWLLLASGIIIMGLAIVIALIPGITTEIYALAETASMVAVLGAVAILSLRYAASR